MRRQSGSRFAGWFPVRVDGPSMLPTLMPGDFLAVSEGTRALRRGRIAVVRLEDGTEIIKRVAAVSGDRHEGLTVPDGQIILTGDNPGQSTDSRALGPFSPANIVGIARAIYWPLRRVRVL